MHRVECFTSVFRMVPKLRMVVIVMLSWFAVPPKINQVHLLATTNNTLVFAWQRPPHNNGATISQYNFQLLHDQQLHENRTMAANENSTRSNYMFVYVALTPGDSYAFQVLLL